MAVCENCGLTFQPKRTSRVGKFCSITCFYAVGPVGPRKATVKRQRGRTVRGHPIAPSSGVVAVSRLTLYEHLGPGPHRCHWCGTSVDWRPGGPGAPDALIVDHLDWDTNNDALENLVPACNACNSKRAAPGKRQKIADGEPTTRVGRYRTRLVEKDCAGCGQPFLSVPSKQRKYCSRACFGNPIKS